MTTFVMMSFRFHEPLGRTVARNSSSNVSGFVRKNTCNFPESDPVWSSCFQVSGSGPPKPSSPLQGPDTGMLTPDVTIVSGMSYMSFRLQWLFPRLLHHDHQFGSCFLYTGVPDPLLFSSHKVPRPTFGARKAGSKLKLKSSFQVKPSHLLTSFSLFLKCFQTHLLTSLARCRSGSLPFLSMRKRILLLSTSFVNKLERGFSFSDFSVEAYTWKFLLSGGGARLGLFDWWWSGMLNGFSVSRGSGIALAFQTLATEVTEICLEWNVVIIIRAKLVDIDTLENQTIFGIEEKAVAGGGNRRHQLPVVVIYTPSLEALIKVIHASGIKRGCNLKITAAVCMGRGEVRQKWTGQEWGCPWEGQVVTQWQRCIEVKTVREYQGVPAYSCRPKAKVEEECEHVLWGEGTYRQTDRDFFLKITIQEKEQFKKYPSVQYGTAPSKAADANCLLGSAELTFPVNDESVADNYVLSSYKVRSHSRSVTGDILSTSVSGVSSGCLSRGVIKLLLRILQSGPSSRPDDDTSEKVIHESSSTSDSERTESDTKTAAPKDDKDQGEVDSSTVTSGVSIPVSDPVKAHEALAGPDPEPMKEDQTGSDSGKITCVSVHGPKPINSLSTKQPEDDQDKSKVREESESTIPDPDQTVTSTPPVIAPFIDVSSSKPSLLVLERHTIDLIEKYSVLPGPESVKNQESEKSPKEIIKAKKEQGEEKQDSTYSIRSTDKVDLEEFDLKSALFRHMNKIKSANRNTANYRLYHALMEALITDEDAMDKEVADKVKDHKRKHDSDDDEDDDDDEGPSAGSNQGRSTKRRRSDSAASGLAKPLSKDDDQSSKKPRESDASASKQHPALTSTGWQITDTREVGVDSSMHRSGLESEHSKQSSDDISMQDEGNDSDMEEKDNAYIPKVSTTTWFKPIPESERPTTPEPEWTIPLNDFPELEHNWANAYATAKKKLCKADLEGPAFNLVKAFHKNNVFLQYQMDECHKLLTNKVDLSNIYEPLPLGGPPGDKERRISLSISKLKATHYLDFGLEELVPSLWVESECEYDISVVYGITHCVISVKVFEKYGYNYLREIILRRADYQEYKISEKDFKNLHPNDFEDLFLLNIQEKLNHLPKTDKTSLHTAVNMWIRNLVIRNRVGDLQLGIESYQTKINLERPNWDAADYYFKEDYTIVPKPRAVVYRDRNDQRKLMRLNELHKFSDGTLTRVMEKLDQMVKDFHLYEYNKGMETRKWSEDDKRRSKDFITAIEKRLQIRRIYRSLESFVGGRIRDIDYRLINRTT
ncbi:hypothetical protein Tco_1106743 [Tanacetum coccineum]